jgi:hypothetical protein
MSISKREFVSVKKRGAKEDTYVVHISFIVIQCNRKNVTPFQNDVISHHIHSLTLLFSSDRPTNRPTMEPGQGKQQAMTAGELVAQTRKNALAARALIFQKMGIAPIAAPAVQGRKRENKPSTKRKREKGPVGPVRRSGRLSGEGAKSTEQGGPTTPHLGLSEEPVEPQPSRLPDGPIKMECLDDGPAFPPLSRDDIVEDPAALGLSDSRAVLQSLQLQESGVAKVVKQRAYSICWHPGASSLLLCCGDKMGNIGLWLNLGESDKAVHQYRPHLGAVSRLQFVPGKSTSLISTSYDGTIRCADLASSNASFQLTYAADEERLGKGNNYTTHSHMPDTNTLYVADSGGGLACVDMRASANPQWWHILRDRKINTVHCDPMRPYRLAVASLDRTVTLWDARKMGGQKFSAALLAEMDHERSVNCAYFSPGSKWLATTCQDDRLYIFDAEKFDSGLPVAKIVHNNQTGRWLTKFHATWHPQFSDVLLCGSMSKNPHGMDVYKILPQGSTKVSGKLFTRLQAEGLMSSIQSLVEGHPSLNAVAGVNSSGRCHIFCSTR